MRRYWKANHWSYHVFRGIYGSRKCSCYF